MEFNNLIEELIDSLDKDESIIEFKKYKKLLLNDKEFLNKINNYQLVKTVDNKKILFSNPTYVNYLKLENDINLIILNIKNKFKFNKSGCQ